VDIVMLEKLLLKINMMTNNYTETPIIINLSGLGSDIFMLINCARELSKKLEYDDEYVLDKLMEGDYENMISTFEDYFGEYVVLIR